MLEGGDFVFGDGSYLQSLRGMLEKFEAYQVACEFYWCCKRLKLPSYLQVQLERASSSIALNLAEGSAKRTHADQRRFYVIAFGSYRETRAILELEQVRSPDVTDLSKRLGAMLYRLSGHPKKPKSDSEKNNQRQDA